MPANGCAETHGSGRLARVWPAVAASVSEARNAVTAFAEAAGAGYDMPTLLRDVLAGPLRFTARQRPVSLRR